MSNAVQIVEVGLRDGIQSIPNFIPTATKLTLLQGLYTAGVRRMEATSFVSTSAVPQLADAAQVVDAVRHLPGLDAQVLVPTVRQAERALVAGACHLAFVLSVSERHNRSNVRRSPEESMQDYAQIIDMLPDNANIRLNIATAFDCPYGGRIDPSATLTMVDCLMKLSPHAEIALCDTTGRVTPDHVGSLFQEVTTRFPGHKKWAFHAHDTYGLGCANVLAAWYAGVRTFDASVAGLGGCPFAPGATGNVATEDLVWMFDGMGVASGIDLHALLDVARTFAALPGAEAGGRVRNALAAPTCATMDTAAAA